MISNMSKSPHPSTSDEVSLFIAYWVWLFGVGLYSSDFIWRQWHTLSRNTLFPYTPESSCNSVHVATISEWRSNYNFSMAIVSTKRLFTLRHAK